MGPVLDEAIAASKGARKDALLAAAAALSGADPTRMMRLAMSVEGERLKVGGRTLDLGSYRRVMVVGWGKAAAMMAKEAEAILGDRITGGLVVVPESQKRLPLLSSIGYEKSSHPLPSESGARAAARLFDMLGDSGEGDLVVCLVSGGGSALIPLPVEGISVDDLRRTTDAMLRSGADIAEINCVRKHISRIKGGRLAQRMTGADVVSLVVSDVVGNDMGTVSSGPTVPDPTTYGMAKEALERRGLWGAVPRSVSVAIQSGVEGFREETPKPGSAAFDRVLNVLIGSNADACTAARARLESFGYAVPVVMGSVTGEARDFGRRLVALAGQGLPSRAWAAVAGGETTVTVRGSGRGGRNEEVALSAAIALAGAKGATVLSIGTDGLDGTSYAAGAIADSATVERAERIGLDPRRFLEENDSHTFFEKLGDLVVTGATGTNVNDVMMILTGRE